MRLPERATRLTGRPELETDFSSIDGLQEHFILLYGRRNDVYLSGRTARAELFYRGVADYLTLQEKKPMRTKLE